MFLFGFGFPAVSAAQSEGAGSLPPKTVDKKFFDSWKFQAGAIIGDLKETNADDDLQIILFMGRFPHSLNTLLGLEDHKGTLSLVLEPFLGHILSPENAVMFGGGLFLEYAYPLTEKIMVRAGAGSGPSYFGADTTEEGHGGFEFFDSAGFGLDFTRDQLEGLSFDFRMVHISDLSLREHNNGINGYAIVLGYNRKF